MQIGSGGNRDDVRLCLTDHHVQIVESGRDAKFIAERVEPIFNQVAQADHFGSKMGVVDSGG